jgi:RNA polymerase sigma-70 factor (ECF subfamily)
MPLYRAPQDAISNSLEISFVERAIRREREAFAALHDCHLDRIYSYISFSLKNAPEAEDLTQEVFIRAWKNIHKYWVTGAPFITWLIAIARNMVADHFRARKKLNTVPLEDEQFSGAAEADPQNLTELRLEQQHLREVIGKLKGEKQQVIIMRFIVGMEYREIAQLLKKREGAIRVIQFRALKELRALLEDEA